MSVLIENYRERHRDAIRDLSVPVSGDKFGFDTTDEEQLLLSRLQIISQEDGDQFWLGVDGAKTVLQRPNTQACFEGRLPQRYCEAKLENYS